MTHKETLQTTSGPFSKLSGLYYTEWMHTLPHADDPARHDFVTEDTTISFMIGERQLVDEVVIRFVDTEGVDRQLTLRRAQQPDDVPEEDRIAADAIYDALIATNDPGSV